LLPAARQAVAVELQLVRTVRDHARIEVDGAQLDRVVELDDLHASTFSAQCATVVGRHW